MKPREVSLDSDRLRAIAAPNGRASYAVFLYRKPEFTVPLDTADANLANGEQRSALVNKLPADLRSESEDLLKALAAAVIAQAIEAADQDTKKAADPFPAIEPWPDAVNGVALLNSIESTLAKYIVLPAHAPVAVTLWIVHTYLLSATEFTPYLLVTSPVRECGKSTLLDLLLHLAHRAMRTGGITAAALYRRIDRLQPTMLLDELDTRLQSEGGEALRGVLNEGFHRGGKITICVGDEHEDRDFAAFCPKVLAGIGRVWDTVTSRSIPLRLNRASREELKMLSKIRGDRIADEFLPYRRQLLRLAEDLRRLVTDADPSQPEQLGARQSDVWRPLLAIADAVGGDWPIRARESAVALHQVAQDEGDHGLLLLEDLRVLVEQHGTDGKVRSSLILEELGKREDRPWSEYRRGQPITANGLASLLKRFDVKPRSMRFPGGDPPTAKGYEVAELRRLFDKYLTPVAQPAEPVVTAVTTQRGVEGQHPCKGGCGTVFSAPGLTCLRCRQRGPARGDAA